MQSGVPIFNAPWAHHPSMWMFADLGIIQTVVGTKQESKKSRKHLRQQQARQLVSESQRKRAAMEDADSEKICEDVSSDSGFQQRMLEEAGPSVTLIFGDLDEAQH